ncbi:hypothetical protein M3223_24240, partial [Paenibacillus pasadenensis]|uniref:hypothetical protein n=1 Tax=Paenibacillus pasadenensis TaxID=217090 RepID=UPI00203DB896
ESLPATEAFKFEASPDASAETFGFQNRLVTHSLSVLKEQVSFYEVFAAFPAGGWREKLQVFQVHIDEGL